MGRYLMYSSTRIVLGLVFITVLILAVPGVAEKPFQVSIQTGPFAPTDYMVHGNQSMLYNFPDGYISGTIMGFGTGVDLIISGQYRKGDWGVILDGGVRIHTNREFKINTYSGRRHFENNLTVIPVTVSVIHKIGIGDSRFTPFIGFGTGIYFSTWETKDVYEQFAYSRTWYKGSDISPGAHFLVGLDYNIFQDFDLKAQYRYSYIYSDWELDDQDSENKIEIYDLNMGGTSLRFGIGYNF
jgi:opacity protein-like surface antigen